MKSMRVTIVFAYLLIDIVFLVIAFYVPYNLYYDFDVSQRFNVDFQMHMMIYAFWIVSTIFLFNTSHLYLTIRDLTLWREARRTIRSFIVSTLITVVFLFFMKIQTLSRLVVIQNFLYALAALVLWRLAKRLFVQRLVASGFNNLSVLIIGAGQVGKHLADVLHKKPYLGYRIAGFLDDHIPVGEMIKGHPVLGRIEDFEAVKRRYFIDHIYITIPSERAIVAKIGYFAKLLGSAVHIIPDHFDLESKEIELHHIDGIPILNYHNVAPNYQMIFVKRVMDLAASTAALIVLAPLFLGIAAAIKLDSKGPVFYVSRRWGKRGKLFDCYKFRSMVTNADELKSDLRNQNEMDGPVFKIKDDPRITRVGKWLRKYSLDELPQIWNVFTGDMSLVGPRPLPKEEEVGEYKLEYLHRLSIKPGLTCLWQIRGRNEIPFKRWMRLDDYYIRNWSPQMDIEILLKTIPAVMKSKGAY